VLIFRWKNSLPFKGGLATPIPLLTSPLKGEELEQRKIGSNQVFSSGMPGVTLWSGFLAFVFILFEGFYGTDT
jgi:hypothetical protein